MSSASDDVLDSQDVHVPSFFICTLTMLIFFIVYYYTVWSFGFMALGIASKGDLFNNSKFYLVQHGLKGTCACAECSISVNMKDGSKHANLYARAADVCYFCGQVIALTSAVYVAKMFLDNFGYNN